MFIFRWFFPRYITLWLLCFFMSFAWRNMFLLNALNQDSQHEHLFRSMCCVCIKKCEYEIPSHCYFFDVSFHCELSFELDSSRFSHFDWISVDHKMNWMNRFEVIKKKWTFSLRSLANEKKKKNDFIKMTFFFSSRYFSIIYCSFVQLLKKRACFQIESAIYSCNTRAHYTRACWEEYLNENCFVFEI